MVKARETKSLERWGHSAKMGSLSPASLCQFWIQAEGWSLALTEILLGEGYQLLAVAKEMKLKSKELQNGQPPPPKTFS